MDKYLNLPIGISVWDEDPSVVTLDLSRTSCMEFSLCLVLLDKSVIDRIRIDGLDSKAIVIAIAPGIGARATGRWRGSTLYLELSATELAYWLSFFLRYFLDGAAPVSHIDLDVTNDLEGIEFTVTVEVARAMPSLSAKEARRRLGL